MFVHPYHPQASYGNSSGNVKKLCEIVSPKFDEESIVSYGVCPVEQMTCEQTSLWIWTFCHLNGWDEAESYAKKFKGQWILGRHLELLTESFLKDCLDINDGLHRKELLLTISYLFSESLVPENKVDSVVPESKVDSTVPESKVDSEALATAYPQGFPTRIMYPSQSFAGSLFSAPLTYSSSAGYWESESSILQNIYVPCPQSYCPSVSAASGVGSYSTDMALCVQTDMSDMVSDSSQAGFINVEGPSIPSKNEGYSMNGMQHLSDIQRPQRNREPVSNQKNGSDNPKKLLPTLTPDQIPENDCSVIRSLFLYLDSTVRVKPKEEQKGKYTIVSKDINAVCQALSDFRNKRYNIRRQFLRPSPRRPVKFIVIAPELLVRKGKSPTSSEVGKVTHGQTIFVNQWKPYYVKEGKVLRARVTKPSEDAEHWENLGWVSRFSPNGGMRLIQRAELQEIR